MNGQDFFVDRIKDLLYRVESGQVMVLEWETGGGYSYNGGLIHNQFQIAWTEVDRGAVANARQSA